MGFQECHVVYIIFYLFVYHAHFIFHQKYNVGDRYNTALLSGLVGIADQCSGSWLLIHENIPSGVGNGMTNESFEEYVVIHVVLASIILVVDIISNQLLNDGSLKIFIIQIYSVPLKEVDYSS
jgi:hypothetical protein